MGVSIALILFGSVSFQLKYDHPSVPSSGEAWLNPTLRRSFWHFPWSGQCLRNVLVSIAQDELPVGTLELVDEAFEAVQQLDFVSGDGAA
jgi:hypothetical protein